MSETEQLNPKPETRNPKPDRFSRAGVVKCPRCGSGLLEHEPNGRWNRFFECPECWNCFHLVFEREAVPYREGSKLKYFQMTSRLERGRNPAQLAASE